MRFLPLFYSAQTLETLPRHIVDLLPRLIAADGHGYNETNFAQRRADAFVRPSAEDCGLADANEVFARLLPQHPMVQHNRSSDQSALKLSDLISQARFHRLQLYDEIYRQMRVEHLMTVGFNQSAAGDVVSLAFSRARSDFSEDDRDLANLLRPHLLQAYRNAEAMTAFRRQFEAREQLLEEITNTAIVTLRNLSIGNASANALRWLKTYFLGRDGFAVNSKLPDDLILWVRHRLAAIDGQRSAAEPCAPLIVKAEYGSLTVRLMPSEREGELFLLLTRTASDDHREALLQFGLTRREADVLLWISRGKTSREIAAILSITRRTVDKHVEHIQAKLGAETRTAAAAIAWRALGR